MASRAEQCVSSRLRAVLTPLREGEVIADTDEFREVLTALEFLVPELLVEVYAEWKWESLDGLYPAYARKTAEAEAEIYGLCLLITDQTLTPIHLRLQVSPSADEVSWVECRVGEKDDRGMVRAPYNSLASSLARLEKIADNIEWVYKVTCGVRRRR